MPKQPGVKKGDKILFKSRFDPKGFEAIFIKGVFNKETKAFTLDITPLNKGKIVHISFLGRKSDFSMEKIK